MKVFVIGSTGMLGKYVSTYLKDYYDLVEINRKDIDVSSIKESELKSRFINLNINEGDVVINCVGAIKPRVDELGDLNAILVNSVFPRILANVCEEFKVKMIHPTTDCVYTGNKGNYSENNIAVYSKNSAYKLIYSTKNWKYVLMCSPPTNSINVKTLIKRENFLNVSVFGWIKK